MGLKHLAKKGKRTAPVAVDIPGWPNVDAEGNTSSENGVEKCQWHVRKITVGESADVLAEISEVEVDQTNPQSPPKVKFHHDRMVNALLFRALCDPHGKREFSDDERELFDSLEQADTSQAFAVAQQLNPMGQAGVKNS